jgi:hypothetical protein
MSTGLREAKLAQRKKLLPSRFNPILEFQEFPSLQREENLFLSDSCEQGDINSDVEISDPVEKKLKIVNIRPSFNSEHGMD